MISSWLKPVKLKEVLPIVNGLFSHIPDGTYTFKCDVTKAQLDYLLLANYSQKITSPAVDMIHEDDRAMLTDSELTTLAGMLLNYYKPKWDKLGEVYDLEYDPVHNYLDEWEDEMDQTNEGTVDGNIVTTDRHNTNVAHHNLQDNDLSAETTFGKEVTRTYDNDDKTNYHSSTAREIDSNNPMTEEVAYGKVDEREDDLEKTNTGEESTVNTGSTTNAVWGFNSSNAVNSDQSTDNNRTSRHFIGDGNGSNPFVEENTGTSTHTLSGKDTTTKTGKYSDDKSGYDQVEHSGTVTDTDDGTETTTNTGTVTDDGYTRTTGDDTRTVDDDRTRTDTIDRDRSGRHFGNIGNITSQSMIKEEIELWKWNYVQTILEDARDFLTIPIYV